MTNNTNNYNKFNIIPLESVLIADSFWRKRLDVNYNVSVHLMLEKLENDHHIDNFRVASGIKKGTQQGAFYFDSDLYKWLEGACYILIKKEDKKLKEKVDEIVDLIVKSQLKDGYVNTFYSTKFLERRFTNVHVMHELYCAGHLIQAALAHYKLTNKKELLGVAIRFANLLVNIFLRGIRNDPPGHEEIEMALVELYRKTKNRDYLELAKKFVDQRGHIKHFKTYTLNQHLNMLLTVKEAEKINKKHEKSLLGEKKEKKVEDEFLVGLSLMNWLKFIQELLNGKMYQLNVPVRKAVEPVGHSVRAMYLYCGMSDIFSETGDKSLLKVLKLLWLRMVKAKMYITGGIGSERGTEGFGKDFTHKNEKSYSETCAAIGSMMWNLRMLQITGNSKHADLIERVMYNAFLVGQSLDGRRYFYSNPMISNSNHERQEWFRCACCPTNFIRAITSIEQYIYSSSNEGLWIHQYIGNNSEISLNSQTIRLEMKSNFPWDGTVKIKIGLKSDLGMKINVRIPRWAQGSKLWINDEIYQRNPTPGTYCKIYKNWNDGDVIKLDFPLNARLVKADPRLKCNANKATIEAGPIVYCLEQKDNPGFDIFKVVIPKKQELRIEYKKNLLEGINIVKGKTIDDKEFIAIPYYAWNNRGPTKMIVWLKSI